ncbi:MAG: penicillin acylase family protein, partial [Deltaproteobacteria bacterium]|nr:penicillin acylase family protein [Deltaproteobacteria bacterium]
MREIAHGRPRRAGPWWPHLLTLPACAVLAASTALLTACGDGADGERATQGAADLGRDGGGNPASDLGGAGADLGPAQRDGGGADGAAAPDLGVEDLGPAADGTADAQADGGPPLPPDQAVLLGVALGGSWVLPGLQQEAHLLLTEAGVPHIYAASKADLGRVLGFVFARDRYFLLEAQRRMALGTLSELFGQDALAMDAESRMLGMAYLAERLTAALDGEMAEYADALAAGINAYIEQVRTGALPPPKELQLAAVMLGLASPAELMRPFDRRDVAALGAVIFYETNFETDDVGRTAEVARLAGLFAGAARGGLRRQGFLADIWNDLRPLFDRSSAAGFGLEQGGDGDGGGGGEGAGAGGQPAAARGKPGRGAAAREARWQLALPQLPGRLPPALLDRAARRLQRVQQRLGRDFAGGFGSNAWAVAGRAAVGGRALLAGDGHLRLSVPSLMYQVALDTRVFGGGETHQIGLLLAGLPVMGVGTNGEVAYSMVNPMVDITDWYREELQLSEDGLPRASRFAGEWRPLSAQVERFVVADVPLLGSAGRTESWTRWTTFDGRWIAEIEGRQAVPDEVLGPGEALVNLQGELVVPGDIDGDGVVTALSFDYTAFDATAVLRTWDRFGHARDVHELREQTRGLVGVGLFLAAADAAGDVLYSSYQAIPCRGYLPRDEAGGWAPGADPTILLDGTRFGGFTIPTRDGLVDEAPG